MFRGLPIGDVEVHAAIAYGDPGLVANDPAPAEYPSHRAIRPANPILGIAGFAAEIGRGGIVGVYPLAVPVQPQVAQNPHGHSV